MTNIAAILEIEVEKLSWKSTRLNGSHKYDIDEVDTFERGRKPSGVHTVRNWLGVRVGKALHLIVDTADGSPVADVCWCRAESKKSKSAQLSGYVLELFDLKEANEHFVLVVTGSVGGFCCC